MSKSGWWKAKDKWLFCLSLGIIFCILAFPMERFLGGSTEKKGQEALQILTNNTNMKQKELTEADDSTALLTGTCVADSYEAELEQRVKSVLEKVDGVGKVDVLIVLKSSAEKVWQTDESSSDSVTEEMDAGGGTHAVESGEWERTTVLVSGNGSSAPVETKELRPEISGIVISAQGGGKATVRAEISSAMEALFGLPAHKIKVLKRVE